jgi:hypothetical protein
MMQVCFFLSMASIHAAYSGFEKIKSKRRHFLLILSAICAMMSALTYEIGLASFLAVGLIAFSKNRVLSVSLHKRKKVNFFRQGRGGDAMPL